MKLRIIYAGLSFALCMTVKAQTSSTDYRTFVEESKTWETYVGEISESCYANRIDGDTLIGGKMWKKVYNYIAFPEFNYTYYVAIREEDKKVYAIAKGSNRPRLLYNFDLKVGDKMRCGVEGNAFGCLLDVDEAPDTFLGFKFEAGLRVECIDTIEARGLKHRRFTLTLLDAYGEHFCNGEELLLGNVVWIEGIGSGAGPFSPWMPLLPECYISVACKDGNHNVVFADFNKDFNPSAVTNHSYKRNKSGIIHDLIGRRLSGVPTRGLYIKSGKKHVVR